MNYYASYDAARSRHPQFLLHELMKLSTMVPTRSHILGRPPDFPLPALFVLLGLKFDAGLSYRSFVAQLSSNPQLLELLGLERAPSYSILQQALRRLDTQLLHRMYQLLARGRPPPSHLAVDATGFSHPTGGEWLAVRCKKTRRRRFTALHAAVDTDTLMVHGVRVKARPGGDARHLAALMGRVDPSQLETVYGDKAYISRQSVQCIADRGAYPAIEPKKGLRARSRGYRDYKELISEYRSDPDEWRRVHEYGQRSLVETVFSMMKVRFTGGLSSRGFREQRRELLIKVILHNLGRLNFLECSGR